MSEATQIKCREPNCNCAVGWVEKDSLGEKIIRLGGRHHGEKHTVRLTEKELLEILREA